MTVARCLRYIGQWAYQKGNNQKHQLAQPHGNHHLSNFTFIPFSRKSLMTAHTSPISPVLENCHPLSDIFSDSPPNSPSHDTRSDIERLRANHSTSGYRSGIAISKASHLQSGFDEGYSLGAALGLKVGYVLGVLEGLYVTLDTILKDPTMKFGTGDDKINEKRVRLKTLLADAERELAIHKIFGQEWWGNDGVWKYKVNGDEEEVTLEKVAGKHPLLISWMGRVIEEMRAFNLGQQIFEGKAWETGRVEE